MNHSKVRATRMKNVMKAAVEDIHRAQARGDDADCELWSEFPRYDEAEQNLVLVDSEAMETLDGGVFPRAHAGQKAENAVLNDLLKTRAPTQLFQFQESTCPVPV